MPGVEFADFTLFAGLDPAALSRLEGAWRRRRFPSGAVLVGAGQVGEAVYLIEAGTVKVHVVEADGTAVTLALLGPGEIVGEMSLLDDQARSADVTTLSPSTLLWLDRAEFRAFLRSMPDLAVNLARLLAARLRLADAQIRSLAAHETETRLARQLMGFAARYGSTAPGGGILIPLRLTQSDLASLVGASRERVNRILVSWRERGYLSSDSGHQLTLNQPDAIARRS
jgi:CRP/FNR family cyclic AMP-dependent transcriptional regulator